MEKDKNPLNQLSAVQRLIILSSLSATGQLPEKATPPSLGRNFENTDLGNPYHGIRSKHQIGMKAPREGKR